MEDLYIEGETGYMNIHMDVFFPCGVQKFKRLLKIIALDWKHEDVLKEKLRTHFQNRISALSDAKADKRIKEQLEKYLKLL